MKTSYTTLALAMLLAPIPALAQEQAAPADPSPAPAGNEGVFEDIVVTANKGAVGESVQRIPVAISAFSDATLQNSQISNLTELNRVPGVQFNDPGGVPGYANFFIRGVGLVGSVRSLEPTVGISIDGMPQEYIIGTILPLEDAAVVEVLRGPQGVLNGRNSTGGAVNLRTKRPTRDFSAEGRVRVGNGGRFDTYGRVSGPIAGDVLLGKISVSHKYSKGLYRDRNGGTFVPAPFNPSGTDNSLKKRESRENSWAIRPTLEFRPIEELSFTLLGEYLDEKGGGAASRIVNVIPNLQTLWGYTPPKDSDEINHDGASYHRLKNRRIILESEYRAGFGVFTSVTGYRKVTYNLQGDVDGTPFTIFHFPKDGQIDDSKQFSQEVRFASDFSDVFRFTVGGFYSRLKFFSRERRVASTAFLQSSSVNRIVSLQGSANQTGTSLAAFYNIEYEPLSGLTLSHGGRYTKDKKRFSVIPLASCGLGEIFTTCSTTSFGGRDSWNNYSPKFSITYEAAPDTTVYGSFTKGYRSGAFNARASSIAAIGPADPETIEQFELGLKTTFLDNRARVNVAVFSSEYKDIQRTVLVNAIQTLSNAANARLRGVELESTLNPFDGLTLSGNVSYIDAQFKEFIGLPGVPPEQAKQLQFEQLPKWTGYAEAVYTFGGPRVMSEDTDISSRIAWTYRGDYFADTVNRAPIEGFGLLDASLALKSDRWTISLYGKNLTNKFWSGQTAVFNFGPPPGNFGVVGFGAPPREFGAEVSFKF
ncbi:TonB-dependent receptor [Sphingomonas sp. 1P06PA]|uniref:TonB-dependent receptor n=1 Tax=Sphingomonas sp. 1P06PA TaxID=554121 RepID=UPI0039A5C5C1